MVKKSTRCDGCTRRDWVRIGGLTAFGFGLGDWMGYQRLHATSLHQTSTAKSCILIWLDGGPSHLETWDPKPLAPTEVRGPIGTVSTSIPGVRISECFPKLAAMLDRVAIIRSMTSPLGEHNFGTHYLMTGYKPTPVLEYPAMGSVVAHVGDSPAVLPPHISIPNFQVGGSDFSGSGFLPGDTKPFEIGSDPARSDFRVRDLDLYRGLDLKRLDRRRQFVAALNQFEGASSSNNSGLLDPDLQKAYDLIASQQAKQAFRLSDEPESVRSRYGNKSVGQSCLLARRLVESGVPFVTINNRGWDTHDDLRTRLKDGFTGARVGVGLIPSLDLALSALLEDLKQRGMLDETLIVVMGEFGRTPKLNTQGGRDHWPRVFSVLMAGGGVAGGTVLGRSDAIGEAPVDDPITPSDLAATVYTLLGVDIDFELPTRDGRTVRVTPHDAKVIDKLIA